MKSTASPGCPRVWTCPAAATGPFSARLLLASAKCNTLVGHRRLMLWLEPPPSGGGTVRAIPLPLNPSLNPSWWPHMVFHSRFFGNAELEGCGLAMLPLIWFRIPHCQPSSKPSGFKVPNLEHNGTFLGIVACLLSVRH